jgi:hypothetical protein
VEDFQELWWRTSKHFGGRTSKHFVEDFQELWWRTSKHFGGRTYKHFVEGLPSTLVDFRSGPSNRHATGDLKRNSKLELISHT